jgi:type II secretory pathway pseudopilin PulG
VLILIQTVLILAHDNSEKILKKNILKAFTVCEVLIVLGILGIVAEYTIPPLVRDFQTQVAIASLKTAYSIISQAYTFAVAENGPPDYWGLTDNDSSGIGATNLLNAFAPYLKIMKNCGTGEGCYPTVTWRLNKTSYLNYNTKTDHAKIILNNGYLIAFYSKSTDCSANYGTSLALSNMCGTIHVDINGFKGPNQWGIDYFSFFVTKYGIIPIGSYAEIINSENKTNFEEHCKDKTTADGLGCTAWVIYNGNMDYLKCDDLSWDGKTKCD